MQQPASSVSSPGSSTFAGMLAALAAPAQNHPPAWNTDDLADDVATLSYERALSAHARYRAAEPLDRSLTGRAPIQPSLTQSSDAGSLRIYEAPPADPERAAPASTTQAAHAVTLEAEPEAAPDISTEPDRKLKCASITIRLSKAECAQLRNRAAEAGLTVSAYLRSCTFEAESLRALVKDTLAQLRSKTSKEDRDATPPPRGSRFRRWRQLWPYARVRQPMTQA